MQRPKNTEELPWHYLQKYALRLCSIVCILFDKWVFAQSQLQTSF